MDLGIDRKQKWNREIGVTLIFSTVLIAFHLVLFSYPLSFPPAPICMTGQSPLDLGHCIVGLHS